MIFAYADPPYIGQAKKMYGDQPEYAGEIDHIELMKTLCDFDAWALSCHSNSLRFLLNAAPESTRVAAWVKPFAYFKKGVNPSYTWEPVLFSGARTDRQRNETDQEMITSIMIDSLRWGTNLFIDSGWLFNTTRVY